MNKEVMQPIVDKYKWSKLKTKIVTTIEKVLIDLDLKEYFMFSQLYSDEFIQTYLDWNINGTRPDNSIWDNDKSETITIFK